MAPPYYNQPYTYNTDAMAELVADTLGSVHTFSGLDLPIIDWDRLDMVSTGAIKELIRKVRKNQTLDEVTKSNHRNDWGYLPGNRYFAVTTAGKVGTHLYDEPIEVAEDSMQFGEFFFSSGADLKKSIKNADRRIVYDRQKDLFYLTLTHYDRWVKGKKNSDGSPNGSGAEVHNPFVRIDNIPHF